MVSKQEDREGDAWGEETSQDAREEHKQGTVGKKKKKEKR
jgi:hypothetical protein